MKKKIKLNYNETFGTTHSREYFRGKSFHYAGEWVPGAHYFSDDYNIDFVSKDNCLLACAKSHLSSLENEPKQYLYDEQGTIIGVISIYWDFVLSGSIGQGVYQLINLKADKVVNAIANHFAALDEEGNLKDSNIALEDIILADDFPIVKGAGENSAQQISSEANGDYSFAVGSGTKAKQKAFKYINTGLVSNQLTLEDDPEGLAVNDVVSIVNSSKYYDCATITAINGRVITFNVLPFNIINESSGPDAKTLFVLAKPDVGTIDISSYAYSEGWNTSAQGIAAHSEGRDTKAYGQYSHAEGRGTEAYYAAHSEGLNTKAIGERSHAEGHSTIASGTNAHSEGTSTNATGNNSHSEGNGTLATGLNAHAEGSASTASGDSSHAEGQGTRASNFMSHAEGWNSIASGQYSHAEGNSTRAVGNGSHAEGDNTTAVGLTSHVEGTSNNAYGNYSHAEGLSNAASGDNSHVEGSSNMTLGANSHAEGTSNSAVGDNSHVEGWDNNASGNASHVEGAKNTASGQWSHAEGTGTTAQNEAEHAEGRYNKSNKVSSIFGNQYNTIHSIGIGGYDNATHTTIQKNAVEVMQNGDLYLTGVGGYDGTNPSTSNTLQEVLGNSVSRVRYGTTEYWRNHDFVPDTGVIIIYSDYETVTEDGITKYYPGIKVGSGNGYLADLAFVGEVERDTLLEHITNTEIHVTSADKLKWNNKLNVDDTQEVVNETLIFNRN